MTDEPPGRSLSEREVPGRAAEMAELQHRWIRIRLLGWSLIGVWQVLSLVSEFVPLDLEQRAIRIAAKATGLVGLVLVAYGFERLAEITHHHEKRWHAFGEKRLDEGGGSAQ